MDRTSSSPNNNDHGVPKVYGDTASIQHSILLFSLGYSTTETNTTTRNVTCKQQSTVQLRLMILSTRKFQQRKSNFPLAHKHNHLLQHLTVHLAAYIPQKWENACHSTRAACTAATKNSPNKQTGQNGIIYLSNWSQVATPCPPNNNKVGILKVYQYM